MQLTITPTAINGLEYFFLKLFENFQYFACKAELCLIFCNPLLFSLDTIVSDYGYRKEKN